MPIDALCSAMRRSALLMSGRRLSRSALRWRVQHPRVIRLEPVGSDVGRSAVVIRSKLKAVVCPLLEVTTRRRRQDQRNHPYRHQTIVCRLSLPERFAARCFRGAKGDTLRVYVHNLHDSESFPSQVTDCDTRPHCSRSAIDSIWARRKNAAPSAARTNDVRDW